MRTLSWSMDVETCEECDRPGELLDGLCHRCRCHGCGDPAAPVELDERRLCMACAIDLSLDHRAVDAPLSEPAHGEHGGAGATTATWAALEEVPSC